MTPSMSKSALLLACQWPWERPEVPPAIVGEPARYGSASHELLAQMIPRQQVLFPIQTAIDTAKRWSIDNDIEPEPLMAHTQSAAEELFRWLKKDNPWKVDLSSALKTAIIEKSIAYNPVTGKARLIANPTADGHIYTERKVGEMPGTVDLALKLALMKKLPARLRKAVLILDYKTGAECDPPGRSAQLASLAVAFAQLWGAERAIVCILHAPRDGVPNVYYDEMTAADLKNHRSRLVTAMGRIGDGSLRPGSHCGYCQALSICPVYGAGMAALARLEPIKANATMALGIPSANPIDLATPEGIGRTHALIKTYDDMRDAIWAEMKAQVRAHGPGIREDGQLVALVNSERDNLSKASILRALGPVEGAKMEKLLRDKGCIEKSKREELRVVPDR